ncbi:hypothetical protein [Actinoplanes sp. NPDC051411]|uniref:hypothetical protein n=1 Tax=Actinoplanes sp. NPDC051411 TaxID=3155522 RepID=UPI003414FDCA
MRSSTAYEETGVRKTGKAAVISRPQHPESDVDFLFPQLGTAVGGVVRSARKLFPRTL